MCKPTWKKVTRCEKTVTTLTTQVSAKSTSSVAFRTSNHSMPINSEMIARVGIVSPMLANAEP